MIHQCCNNIQVHLFDKQIHVHVQGSWLATLYTCVLKIGRFLWLLFLQLTKIGSLNRNDFYELNESQFLICKYRTMDPAFCIGRHYFNTISFSVYQTLYTGPKVRKE